jgi:Protein of unknown function (DUF3179)
VNLKLSVSTALFKVPLIAIGVAVLCLATSFALTDPAPTTLPRRTWRLLQDIAALPSSPATDLPADLPSAPPEFVPYPPVTYVPVVNVEGAREDVQDECYVVGVELNGESRAYPLNMLSRPDQHVLNDILGGQPIAVTWCGLCQSPLVYARRVEDHTLTFYVAGYLYGENMVIKDMETGSNWPQMAGEALDGPLKGKSLDRMPMVWTDWKSWRTDHPETTLAKLTQTVDYYRHDSEPAGLAFQTRLFSNFQWGFVRQGKALSWPLKEFASLPAVNDTFEGLPLVVVYDSRSVTIAAFERRLGDTELTFHWGAEGLVDDQTSSVWDPVTGRAIRGKLTDRRLTPVAGIVSHIRAWRSLHPETEVRVAHKG